MSTSADRMRRLRAREHDGKVRLTLLLTPHAIANLLPLGWLTSETNPQANRRAMALFIRAALRGDHLNSQRKM
jgi:hypothetical protein